MPAKNATISRMGVEDQSQKPATGLSRSQRRRRRARQQAQRRAAAADTSRTQKQAPRQQAPQSSKKKSGQRPSPQPDRAPQGRQQAQAQAASSPKGTPKPGPRPGAHSQPATHPKPQARPRPQGRRRNTPGQTYAANQAANNAPNTRSQQPKTPTTQDELSAGGLVLSGLSEAVDKNNKVDLAKIYVALIGRLDRRGRILWSMPKGHVEPHEDIPSAAAREVWEETGIVAEVFEELGTIDYWFVSEGVRIHKTVHHHLLRYVDGELNDEDPEVTQVAWVPAKELTEYFAYADERKLARKAFRLLPKIARAEHATGRVTPR